MYPGMYTIKSLLMYNASLHQANDSIKFQSKLVYWEDHIVGTYLVIVCILAVALNALVIYTCIKNWNSLVMSDYYILNLACSDVILPLSGFPLAISSSYSHKWLYDDLGCTLYGFIGFFFGLSSITTLTVMGITRYISICHPQIDVSNMDVTKKFIIFIYIYALAWSLIPLSGWGSYSVESYGTSCTLQWTENRIYITSMAIFCIVMPSVVMMMTYGCILVKCHQSGRNVTTWQRQHRGSKLPRKESYLVKITFAMCWGFLVSWMPYGIVSMWSAYGNPDVLPHRVTVIAVLLAKSSTVVNPVIYFLFSKKFRPLLSESLNINLCRWTHKLKKRNSDRSKATRSSSLGNVSPDSTDKRSRFVALFREKGECSDEVFV